MSRTQFGQATTITTSTTH